MAEQFAMNVAQIAQTLGGDAQAIARATAILTAIVGAVSMSRAVGDAGIAKEILANTRALVLQTHAGGMSDGELASTTRRAGRRRCSS